MPTLVSPAPSLRHRLLAKAIPRIQRSSELEDLERERLRLLDCQAELAPGLSTALVPLFARRFSVEVEQLVGPAGEFPAYTVVPRGRRPRRTVLYVHGGGFVGAMDAVHVRYAARLARELDARIVLPTYPLAPAHSWRDSHDAVADLAERWAKDSPDGLVLAGDSAGGGYALAVALTLRDRGGAQPDRLLLHSPWVDLTASTPDTPDYNERDPWLFLGKAQAYAHWWAGSEEDLGRPEVSPALGDLSGLPPTLMFCGTLDLLVPGCRLLADRAAATDWDLTYLEAPDLIHVFPILPFLPEARVAWRRTVAFLR